MSGRLATSCELCGNELRTALDLGSSPPTCAMAPVPPAGGHRYAECHYPLELLYCDNCGLGQLSVVVDPAEMFPPDYPYQSGNSRALHEDFADLARQATRYVSGLDSDDLVVDIGANDGTLLSKFDGCRKVAVEPTAQADKVTADSVYQAFFTEDLAKLIVREHGHAQVVTACNVLAHVEDINDVMRGINVLLADGGILLAENHNMASVVEGSQWDTIYHEHLRFFDPYSFGKLLAKHGMETHGKAQTIATHGGSFRVIAQRGAGDGTGIRPRYDFERLARSATTVRAELRRTLAQGAVGIGATARATTLINYCGFDVEDIECVCEVPGSDKIGRYIPGTRIPVVDEARLLKGSPPAVLFSWHLADAIVPKLRERGHDGAVLIPLPTPRYL